MPLVSVIVPIYKVEAYLRECVESILNQTHRNLEVILVDDGSPDNCGVICDEYAGKDSRIKVIHKENGGLSDARNYGLRIAAGDYICFVDSDDKLPCDSVEKLVELAQEHSAQIVVAGFERFEDETGEVFFSTESSPLQVLTLDKAALMKNFFVDGCQAWAVLYEKQMHDGIEFPKGEINEDEAIVFHIYDRCECAVVTNMVVYSYRHRSESITTSAFSPKKLIWIKHCRENLAFVQEKYPELEPDAAARYRGSLLWALREIALSGQSFPEEVKALQQELRANHTLFEKAPFVNRGDQLRYYLLKHFPLGIYKSVLRLRHST